MYGGVRPSLQTENARAYDRLAIGIPNQRTNGRTAVRISDDCPIQSASFSTTNIDRPILVAVHGVKCNPFGAINHVDGTGVIRPICITFRCLRHCKHWHAPGYRERAYNRAGVHLRVQHRRQHRWLRASSNADNTPAMQSRDVVFGQ